MSRKWGIAPVMVLAACLLAGGLGYGPAGTGRAEAGCLKIWHEKKVTRWVKGKNGKRHKVTKVKRYWTCDPYEAPGPPRLGIAATEFKFTLSRPRIRRGNLMLEFSNRGEDVHNVRIAPAGSSRVVGSAADTEPGSVTDAEFRIKPGRYRLWCSLPGHAKLGMKAKLRVLR